MPEGEWIRAWNSASCFTNRYGGFRASGLSAVPAVMPIKQALQVLQRHSPAACETIRRRIRMYKMYADQHEVGGASARGLDDLLDYVDRLPGMPLPTDVPKSEEIDKFVVAGQAHDISHGGESEHPCFWRAPPIAGYDGANLITKVTVRGAIERAFCEIKKCLNPVNWANTLTEGSGFSRSYKVELQGDHVVYDPDGFPRRAEPQPGETECWEGVLFEDVDWSWNGAPITRFCNLLNIKFYQPEASPTNASGPELVLEYDLRQSLSSDLMGLPRPGGLEIDSGVAKVYEVEAALKASDVLSEDDRRLLQSINCSSRTFFFVTVSKAMRFASLSPGIVSGAPLSSGQIMNYLAPSIMTSWMDLAVSLGVFNIHMKGNP
jgi:hypothetical protein